MQVSIINLNLVEQDAIGQIILHQLRFFRRNGDAVQVYTEHAPEGLSEADSAAVHPVSLGELISGREQHFAGSDLYIYHYPCRYTLIESIKTLARGSVIFYFHNVTPPAYAQNEQERELLQTSLDSVAALAAFADLAVTDSEYNAQQLIAEHRVEESRVRVLAPAAPLERFSPGAADPAFLERYGLKGRRIILFVGRMAANKRVDLLIDALAAVRQTERTAALLLVGDNDGNESIRATTAAARARAAALGVDDAVVFAGRVDDLPAHYRLADVYATASLHEGFGVPLLEAMASGTPVVASDTTAHPFVLADVGLLVEAGNVAAMAAQIERLFQDDRYYGHQVQRGLARARAFSLDAYLHGWAAIVAEATSWLPKGAYPSPTTIVSSGEQRPRRQLIDVDEIGSLIDDDLRQLEAKAEVMPRGYRIHSQLPVVGPLIAWIRRNLTSHLKEPYVDPTFKRQDEFNWQTVQTLQILTALITQNRIEEGELAAAQSRIAALEQQVAALVAERDRDEIP